MIKNHYNKSRRLDMKLKELREQKGLSQYEIAPLLNLKQATYANYEIGKTQPTIETLCIIADYYGVSLDYLCDHKTQNTFQFGYLDEQSKQIIQITQTLNTQNKDKAITYLKGLSDGQN